MRKMILIIGLVVAAVSISGMALALDPGLNPSTGTPTPQYSSEPSGGMGLSNFDPGISGSTGMPSAPGSSKSLGGSNGIEPYDPGLNPQTGMPTTSVSPGPVR